MLAWVSSFSSVSLKQHSHCSINPSFQSKFCNFVQNSVDFKTPSTAVKRAHLFTSVVPSIHMSSSTPMTGDLDHVAFGCQMPAIELANWYRDVLGFEPIDFDNPKKPFISVRISQYTILDFFNIPPGETTDSNKPSSKALSDYSHLCIAVAKPQFDDLITRLKSHDVDFSYPPKKLSGARGDGWGIFFHDPDGNRLEFRYYE